VDQYLDLFRDLKSIFIDGNIREGLGGIGCVSAEEFIGSTV